MDAQAVSAALTPAALAPAIAKRLGLPPAEVETALGLLAQGAQPAFIARYRGDRVKELRIDDLERIQTAAAQAVGFELRRQQVAAELAARGTVGPMIDRELLAASHPLDLDDVRSVATRKKRPVVVRARIGGLTPLALALWTHGSAGDFSDADSIPAELLAVPSRSVLGKKRKRKRSRKKPAPVEVTAETQASDPSHEQTGAEGPAPASPEAVDAAQTDDAGTEAPPAVEQLGAAPEDANAPQLVAAEGGPAETVERSDAAETSEQAESTSAPVEAQPAAEPQPPEIPSFDGETLAAAVTADAVPDDESALAGARSICADLLVEHPGVRRLLRRLTMTRGKLTTAVVEAKKDRAARYSKFFERAEVCSSMAPNNVLAVQRAERDGLLSVSIEVDAEMIYKEVASLLKVADEGAAADVLRGAIEEAWTHGGLSKAISGCVRRQMKERADRAIIPNLCESLRPQLLAPAFGRRPLLCIDPGTQHGCRLIALSAEGLVVAEDTVYPLQPKLQAPQAKARIAELCTENKVELVVVVGGAGARDVEKLARAALAETEGAPEIAVHTVDSDAVGSLAGGKALKAEFPKADAATRRAVAAGRRVQDPLTTLGKADLRKLSLGQHQFDVDPEALRQALEQVVGTSIAKVSVDLNTVDLDTLGRVPGMSQALAKAVVAHRDGKDGGFRSRNELLEVPGLVGKAFEQAAGFLRVVGGEQPLDATPIHPERYAQVAQMARALDTTVPELLGDAAKVDALDPEPFLGQPGVSGEPLGPRGLSQIQAALRQPSRDPRPAFEVAAFHPDLGSFGDLKVDMELEGVITHLAGFGAFVDVGIPQEGLIHLSELSHDYVSAAGDVVHVGQRVKGKVIEITAEKKRFALSLKALVPAPQRPARERGDRDRNDRSRRGGNGGRDGRSKGGKGKGGRPGSKDGGRKEKREDKVLGFRMDLSDLASRLGKG
ncbi:MAG: helix-hairpin-helix domain-containing protein [Nannocystales bacterium]